MNSRSSLQGVSVAVTRPENRADDLVRLLADRGALPVEVPLIAIAEPADGGQALRAAAAAIDTYDWVVLTSQNGAERFCAELGDPAGMDRVDVAAVGRATAEVLEAEGVHVALVPERQLSQGLLDAFPTPPAGGGSILLARAAQGSEVFAEGARRKGWLVDDVACYQTVAAAVSEAQVRLLGEAHVVTFTSPSAVRAFVAVLPNDSAVPVVACIGPSTQAMARELGLLVAVAAPEHSLEGLVDSIERHVVASR